MPDTDLESRSDEKPKGYLDRMGYDPDKRLKDKVAEVPEEIRPAPREQVRASGVKKGGRRTGLVLFGIVLIILSAVFAIMSLQDPGQDTIEDTVEYNMFRYVLASKELNRDNGPGSRCYSAGSVMSLQADELKQDIADADDQYRDYEFSIEIIDVSDYPVEYTRSRSAGNDITTAEPPDGDGSGRVRTFETAVNVFVDDDEVHTARFIMQIWKA